VSSPVWRRRRLLVNVKRSTRQVRRGLAVLQHGAHRLDPATRRLVIGLGQALEAYELADRASRRRRRRG
jgi:hypothetical protein